jgi:hypothetical protein
MTCRQGAGALLLGSFGRKMSMEVLHMENDKPVHTIRFGRIKATIWANEGVNGPWYSVQVYRIYMVGEEWKQTASFGCGDPLLASKVLDQAHTWIYQQADSSRPAREADGTQDDVGTHEWQDVPF